MTSCNAPLPALQRTAPARSGATSKGKVGKGKKNAFSLDSLLSSTHPVMSPPPYSTTAPATFPLQKNLLHSDASERKAMSPAEALLAGNGVLAPLSSSTSNPLCAAPASWRSQLLQCETQLREVIAKGVHEPPSLDRILHVMSLYDLFTSELQMNQGGAFLASILRLFRVEFCRAIFIDGSGPAEGESTSTEAPSSKSGATTTNATATSIDYDGLPQTYFEETDSLRRTKAALTSTLANTASGETLLLLERQLVDKAEQVTWYEGELERVRSQYEQIAEECLRLRETLEVQQCEAAATEKRLQQNIQTIHVENKDLQIQLFRLRKQIAGGMSTLLKDSYRQLKLSKIGLTQRLFNEGDERIALLVFLGQVESRVNEILDSYDNDFVLTSENGRSDLQLRMAENVVVLLEDMHYCEATYRRLVGAQHVRVVERGKRTASATTARGETGRSLGESTVTPSLQRIPVSLVHSGKDEEAPDESDGYVAILFDPKIYEQFHARNAIRTKLQHFKKKQEENARTAAARERNGSGRYSFPSSDATSITTAGAGETDEALTRNQSLNTILSDEFDQDPLSVERLSSERGVALGELGAANATNVPFDEKLKKWSLDSSTLATVTPTLSAQPSVQSALGINESKSTATTKKLEKPLFMPGSRTAKRLGFRTVSVPKRTGASVEKRQEQRHHQNDVILALDTSAAQPGSFEEVVERQKTEWVAQILGQPSYSVAFTVPGRHPERGDVVVVHEKSAEVVPAELMMRRVLRHPMEDLCTERFLSTVELFTGENPAQQRLLCRVNHIDPSLPIRVPESTCFVKVKYALSENAVPPGSTTRSASTTVTTATVGTEAGRVGGADAASAADEINSKPALFRGNPSLRLFKVLSNQALAEGNLGLQYCAGAVNSTTASTVAFQRLHPMSPNRAPEWLLYQQLFGSYRSLAPRMIELTTIDHVMACASERYFTRMEFRYNECFTRAAGQCTNVLLRRDMAERLFKDLYSLSDFQEALVDELEARYGFPELVAKTLYEMLCYLNAVGEKDAVLGTYLGVIRGFAAPTEIHFISYMLYHLSYCWPESNPSTAVPVENVRTVLEYVYRNASTIMPINLDAILNDYDMTTRSAPLNFVNFRQFIASTMTHQEEPILLHLHGLFHTYTQRSLVDEARWDTYEAVIGKQWRQKDERRSLVRYLTSCLGVNRTSPPTLLQLTLLAASAWSSNLWE
ncbi:hypothetical protein ABL78_5490 [Leptomonas seymouri]|uniref:Uncharacterized protein n=1 Tax=Leptomonas seymouri TaxID=5684 RepID=A0A0N0P4M3_LEPSE|nr:hypothetical protein ABL78_5490 [Leptomonas seymouri]|eukprot:KPI85469.1 hypothetical protein ABL78_5490 [Leptomonas seymouri]